MALQKITNKEIEEKQVASLPDRMTGTAAENKAAFDALVKAVIEKYNEVIETLSGLSGAASIGSEPFAGVGTAATVRDQLIALQKGLSDAVAGSIPDASITTAKLADAAVDGAKLADAAVTEAKIKDAEVTAAKIRDLAIETAKIANLAVTTAKIKDGNVTTEKLADGNVTTEKLADGAVTLAKMQTELQSQFTKTQLGTYTGTGGTSVTLNFNFNPIVVFVVQNKNVNTSANASGSKILIKGAAVASSTAKMDTDYVTLSWGTNKVTFTGTTAQFASNLGSTSYRWLAIG